jgi:hypothetical protein
MRFTITDLLCITFVCAFGIAAWQFTAEIWVYLSRALSQLVAIDDSGLLAVLSGMLAAAIIVTTLRKCDSLQKLVGHTTIVIWLVIMALGFASTSASLGL